MKLGDAQDEDGKSDCEKSGEQTKRRQGTDEKDPPNGISQDGAGICCQTGLTVCDNTLSDRKPGNFQKYERFDLPHTAVGSC